MPKGCESFLYLHMHSKCTLNGSGAGPVPTSTAPRCQALNTKQKAVEAAPLNYELSEEFSKPGAPELSTFWEAHELVPKSYLNSWIRSRKKSPKAGDGASFPSRGRAPRCLGRHRSRRVRRNVKRVQEFIHGT